VGDADVAMLITVHRAATTQPASAQPSATATPTSGASARPRATADAAQ